MNMLYGKSFYNNENAKALSSARVIVPMILEFLPETRSVVDFGCGYGAWLSVFKKNGVNDVLGLDGEWVGREGLLIDEAEFSVRDLSKPAVVNRKYDLAISLEVAEHLPEGSAEAIVGSMVSASDNVIFSAAIPYQGGTNHINEQWPDYWAGLFAKRGFICMDVFREKIWDNERVAPFYSQNILFYRRAGMDDTPPTPPRRLVHHKIRLQRVIVRILGKRLTNVADKIKNMLPNRKWVSRGGDE